MSGGEWHYCYSCKSAGDMIDLAAVFWKIDVPSAVARLKESGELPATLLEEVNSYLEESYYRKEVVTAWSSLQPNYETSESEWFALLKGLSLTPQIHRMQWHNRLGRHVGLLPPVKEGGPFLLHRMIGGPPSQKAVIVPYWDLPGRIRGFYGARNSDGNEMTLFRAVSRAPGIRVSADADHGFGMLPSVFHCPNHHFGDKVFVVSDPKLALLIHDHHFRDYAAAVPVVSIPPDSSIRPVFNSGVFWGRKMYCWGPRVTPELLRMAKDCRGRITTDESHQDSSIKRVRKITAKKWLESVVDQSLSWEEVTGHYIDAASDLEVVHLLNYLEMSPSDERELASCIGKDTGARLLSMRRKSSYKEISIGGRRYVEEEGLWYSHPRTGPRSLLSEGVLRIDQVITGESTHYRGRILFKGQELPFSVPSGTLGGNVFSWMREELLRANMGMMSYQTTKEALSIAAQFHPPETVAGVTRYGWVERYAAFVFENFAISSKGDLVDVPVCPLASAIVPTRGLAAPSPLLPEEVNLLSRDSVETPLVWGILAAILANLLSPVRNRIPSGIALSGQGAEFLGRAISRLAGCAEQRLWNQFRHQSFAPLLGGREHGWPLMIVPDDRYSPCLASEWAAREGQNNCICSVDWFVARALSMSSGWNILESDYPFSSVVEYRGAIPKVIPLLLMHLGKNSLRLPNEADSFVGSVVSGISRWFHGLGGDFGAVESLWSVLRPDLMSTSLHSRAIVDQFADILCRSYEEGTISVGEKRSRAGRAAIPSLLDLGNEGFFIPKAGLNRVLSQKGAPPVDSLIISRAMASEGILTSEAQAGRPPQPGWVVPRDWWEKKWSLWNKVRNTSFKVVG